MERTNCSTTDKRSRRAVKVMPLATINTDNTKANAMRSKIMLAATPAARKAFAGVAKERRGTLQNGGGAAGARMRLRPKRLSRRFASCSSNPFCEVCSFPRTCRMVKLCHGMNEFITNALHYTRTSPKKQRFRDISLLVRG